MLPGGIRDKDRGRRRKPSARLLKTAEFPAFLPGKTARRIAKTAPPLYTFQRSAAGGDGRGLRGPVVEGTVVRMSGYDGEVSLEMEDLTLSMLDGHISSLRTLKEALVL